MQSRKEKICEINSPQIKIALGSKTKDNNLLHQILIDWMVWNCMQQSIHIYQVNLMNKITENQNNKIPSFQLKRVEF